MFSENARFLRQGLIERYRAMTPEQRIRAFIDHSLRMRRLRDLGKADRAKAREAEISRGGSGSIFAMGPQVKPRETGENPDG